jgi:hypothetical protein
MGINKFWFLDYQPQTVRAAFEQGVDKMPYFWIFVRLPDETGHFTVSQRYLDVKIKVS